MRFLDRPNLAKLLLRVCPATMLIFGHGWSKLMRIVSWNWEFADPIGIGVVPSLILATSAEFFCSLAVIVGFKTRLAAIPLLITMLVAALVHHAADPFSRKELPLLYAAAFLAIILLGPGRYSLDKS